MMYDPHPFRAFLLDHGHDAAWIAYDIEGMAAQLNSKSLQGALKLLSVPPGETSTKLDWVAAQYELDFDQVRKLVSEWYVWRSIANGTRKRAIPRRVNNG